MVKVLLDTNFIIMILKYKIDLFGELDRILDGKYEVILVDKSVNELEKLINQSEGSRTSRIAKLALQLIDSEEIEIIRTEGDGDVDSLIVDLQDKNMIIATQDKKLKERIKKSPKLIIKQKKYLQLQNVL